MSDVLIEAMNVSKRYPLVAHSHDRLRALLTLAVGRMPKKPVCVLDDVSLSVKRSESLGVIGRNGAGKSTLLKLITGVLNASSGNIKRSGSTGALLELGAGFHPEYSGRDNVRMAAALHGLHGEKLQQALPGIEAFADIGRYFDEPVKHYSTGMVVRLGFSVIAAIRPDILITDEVLAVGDESFQRKCIAWIDDYLAQGGTLILVSHSMYHIQKLCKHALWLNEGRIMAYGDVFDVSQRYLAWHAQFEETSKKNATAENEKSAPMHRISRLSVSGYDDAVTVDIEQHQPLNLQIEVQSDSDELPHVLVGIARADGMPIYGVSTEIDAVQMHRLSTNKAMATLHFSDLPLLPGSYRIKAHAMDRQALRLFDTVERELIIRGQSREFGTVQLQHVWNKDL